MSPPDFLVIGQIVKDITPSGWRIGGSVAYATHQASLLGLNTASVTSCAEDVRPAELLPQVDWRVVASAQTTTFENRYVAGHREQRVLAQATPLSLADLPSDWREAPLILLAPVYHDVDPALPGQLNTS